MGETSPASTTPFDPYALTPEAVREAPPTLGQALRRIGPGMILAASIVGTGELIATTHAGAQAGFVLLWLVLLSCFIKVFVQIELGRLAISTGETTLNSFARLPGPGRLFIYWWFFMMVATQAQISAMIGGIAQCFHLALPLFADMARPALPWGVGITIATGLLLYYGTYSLIERSMTAMVVIFTVLTVGCVFLLPFTDYAFGWNELASGLTFHLPTETAVIAAAFTMVGITGVGASELVSYPYWCIEKGYARYVGPADGSEGWLRRAKGWLAVMKLDAWVSMIVYTVATVAFFILGAAVLHSQQRGTPGAATEKGLPGDLSGLLESLTRMYEPVLGPNVALAFIIVGAFAVLFSTLVSATAANARLVTDFLKVGGYIAPHGPKERFRWVQGASTAILIFAFTLFAFFPNPVLMVMIGGFAQAITLPLIAAAAIYMRYRRADRRVTPGVIWDAFLWLSLLAFIAAAVYGVWSQLEKLL